MPLCFQEMIRFSRHHAEDIHALQEHCVQWHLQSQPHPPHDEFLLCRPWRDILHDGGSRYSQHAYDSRCDPERRWRKDERRHDLPALPASFRKILCFYCSGNAIKKRICYKIHSAKWRWISIKFEGTNANKYIQNRLQRRKWSGWNTDGCDLSTRVISE